MLVSNYFCVSILLSKCTIQTMSRNKCCVPLCSTTINDGVHLHSFPDPVKHAERFKTWVLKIGGELLGSDTSIFKNRRVCHKHFPASVIYLSNRLSKSAVPILHLPDSSTVAMPVSSVDDLIPSTSQASTLPRKESVKKGSDGIILHVFPNYGKDSERFQAWVYAIGADLLALDNETIMKYRRVCHNHFEPRYYTSSKRLCANAVPTLKLSVTAAPNITVNATFQPSKPMIISEGYNSEPSVSAPSGSCVESVAANTCKTADKTTSADIRSIPKENNADYWKQKLTHILHTTQFCGICLSTDELVNTVSDYFEIVVAGTSLSRTLADILDVVFQETEDILSNSQICSSCTQKLLQSYMFIQQARARSKMLNCHLNDLYYKTCYIGNKVLEDLARENSDVSNVLISMENYDNIDQFQNNLYTKPAKKEVKRDCRRMKQSYKCLTCNLILPSHKAWRVHEITNHKINKMSKTQLNSGTPHQRILKRTCRICHKVVKNGLIKHLKKYHMDSLCPVCSVAFESLDNLEAHKLEWHYSDVSKCLTCLRSYSEAELQQHRCWFSCNVCTEAPCVHHKYLTCYRQQILNGALRAKCLDCRFVCRTKRVYLKHVNMCHLKFSAESLVKCTE